MPKFNKGDKVRVRLTSHSRYRGQIGVVEDSFENHSTSPVSSSSTWYMVRFEWKGLHPAARFMEEDIESPTTEIISEEIPVTAGPTRQSWRDRIIPQPAMRKYYIVAIAVILVVAAILVGLNLRDKSVLPNRPEFSSNQTQLPGLTEQRTTTKLAFTTSFAEVKAGFSFPVQPVVEILDADGNIVADSTAPVTLQVTDRKAILYGTTTVNAVNGIATFTELNIRSAGYNYSLTALSSGSTSALSNTFNVVPSPAIILGFSGDPFSSGLGSNFSIKVTVLDLFRNVVTDSTAEVTISLADSSSAEGAILSGTTTQKAINGVVTFSYLAIDPVDGEYELTATSPGMIAAISDSFNPIKIAASASSQ